MQARGLGALRDVRTTTKVPDNALLRPKRSPSFLTFVSSVPLSEAPKALPSIPIASVT